ncbi:MAG: zf-HC2 domain-containing protein [Acidimicrobiia bacterium]
MNHDEIQGLLEDYVDEKLDRTTRREVDQHLKTCTECRAILDHVAPVDIVSVGPSRYDERTMKRTVRRGLFRTALTAALLLLAGWIVFWFASVLLFQPFLVNRGDRAVAAARASIDVPTMLNPGAVVSDGTIESGIFDRRMEFDVVLPVGSGERNLGPIAVRLGATSLVGEDQFQPWPHLIEQTSSGSAREQLANLGDGTVATVQLFWTDPLTVAEAQQIADATDPDIRVVWAGFDINAGTSPQSWAGGILGYGTCVGPETIDDATLGATSASFGRTVNSLPASIETALNSVRDGLANLVEHPELLGYVGASQSAGDLEIASSRLDGPNPVRTLVVTGPSSEIKGFLDEYSPDELSGQVLAIDFYNWTSGLCGR